MRQRFIVSSRYTWLAGCIAMVCFSGQVHADKYSFDVAQLGDEGKNVDISLFEQGVQLPGVYHVDVMLNGKRVDSRDMVFHLAKNADGQPVLKTCLTRERLMHYGIKIDDYPGLFPVEKGKDEAEQCARLSAIPQATEDFQFYSQQLLLGIPQVALRPHFRGIAPQALWNDGIPAFLMNYQASVYRTEYRGGGVIGGSNSGIMLLEPGLNLGAWRFRNLTSWQKQGNAPGKWQTTYIYAERGLNNLKSRLTLGDRFTPSGVFDSVPFRGGMLGSDETMVPYSQRAFAPVIQGIARTQARIEVKQNDYVIYNTTVAPGPYALTDLPLGGSGGDLQVTVFESDGTRQVFSVPYTAPAIALRQGYLKYNLMGGQYRPANSTVDNAAVGQLTVMYGLPWNLTAYGGLQWAKYYQAGALGLGVSLGHFGALSVDGIQARGKKQHQETVRGQTWRVRYTKLFETTQTGFTLASYQYASSGYSSLSEVLETYRRKHDGDWGAAEWYFREAAARRKSRTSVTLSQSLGAWGAISLSGNRETYWNRALHQDSVSARYSGPSIKGVSWSVDWTQQARLRGYDQDNTQKAEQSVGLWVSMPLSNWVGGNTYATYQMQNNTGLATQHDMGLGGQSLNNQLSWDVREHMVPGSRYDNQDSSNLHLRYTGTYGEVSGGYGYSKFSRQMNAGIQGGMVIHQHGVTLGQRLGNAIALVEAPGVSGVSVGGWPGVNTDFRGYTTLGYLSPYQENIITLNPTTLPPDAEIQQTDMMVVPTGGAVIPAAFVTRVGGRAVITLTRPQGKQVPFGAVASATGQGAQQIGAGVVGDEGEVYISGLPEHGHLLVQWGDGQQQRCRVDYHLPEVRPASGVYALTAVCN